MGVTGSGKTFTMANVIKAYGKPTLVLSHNKTLAAQLYSEFKDSSPTTRSITSSATTTTISPRRTSRSGNIYIEKDASINESIDRYGLAATSALMSRTDVVIICQRLVQLRRLGSPEDYRAMVVGLRKGMTIDRDELCSSWSTCNTRATISSSPAACFACGATVSELWPSYEEFAYRIEFGGTRSTSCRSSTPPAARHQQARRVVHLSC